LKSSSTTSSSEVETLRTRIVSLESANRDTVALLESKTTANDNISQDLQKQHQKGLELSQQLTIIQQTLQNANSAASSARFREQSLVQEVELAKQSNEWFENELKTKSAEALKYRKEKGAKIAELQRVNEEVNATAEALKRSEIALRTRFDEVQMKAEDSLLRVQQLQEAAAKSEESFRQELESARRLAELKSQQTETHRTRLKDIEEQLEREKDEKAAEVGRCRQEVEAERHEREQSELRISELEAEVDNLGVMLASRGRGPSVPGTPRQNLNGSRMGLSGSPAPFGTPSSTRKTMTVTEAVGELYKVKGQLATEKRRGDKLQAEIDDMISQVEAKQPVIEEMESEYERLQQEVVEMSRFVDQTIKERERARKDARKAESEASTVRVENNILQQQLRDLSAQIKLLLCEIDAKERGLDALSAKEQSHLERLARGEIEDEEALEGLTDTDRYISQRLTVFRNVRELEERNIELLRVTRELGARMEEMEAKEAEAKIAHDNEEALDLKAKIEGYKDELQSMVIRANSYVKERDMFRRMLQHRGPPPAGSEHASVFGRSVDEDQNGLIPTIEENSDANYAAALKAQTAQYDQYREETTIDRKTMKEQIERLSQEKGALLAEIAKTSSQLTLANERYEMLHSNYTMLQNENVELQKRAQLLSESAAKQDLRTQQVAEDLVEAKGMVESMRNENSNLKAEKKLWKDIQDRLSQDNESLMNERGRLNNLVANQQMLQNERELSDSETRRRLQSQVESLEAELNTTKRKLGDEVENSKKAQLRKEYDSQQNQKRIDDLASSLSQAREDLVAAKTTRDHLQSRVDELAIELKSAEERVELLQPRPTPRPTAGGIGGDDSAVQDESLSKEQELAIEVSELKRDLELARAELENAKSQMEQYKSISQSSEEELQNFSATQDQYREDMDQIIGEKDTKIRELQQRTDDISAELTTTNNDLTKLRNEYAEIARTVEEEKSSLVTEISRLKDEGERHAMAAQFHQQDLRAQAAIATKAQQDYENELVKHAEAAKSLQALRSEYNQLKTDSAGFKAEAESARVTLSQNESSWEERREQFERELAESRTRRDDTNTQHKLLHQQLESVGIQIAALQQSRSSAIDATDAGSPNAEAVSDRTTEGLRELNSFLRREKEIVEVQYELKIQEAKRLQQQLDYAQSQLDENRLKLDQERRLNADGGRSSSVQKDLMEKLNELNLFRESSITLRNEARQAQTHLSDKTKRVEELTEQIQPLENRIRELEHGKESAEGEMKLLQEDRDRWQKRTQDIISKYDRIDPVEMEQLKETIETLKAERDSIVEQQQPMEEKIHTLEAEKLAWGESRKKIVDQAKEKNRQNAELIKARTAERDTAYSEKESLQLQISSLQQELETAVLEKTVAEQRLVSLVQEIETLRLERDQAVTQATQSSSDQTLASSATKLQTNTALDLQIADLRQQLNAVTKEKQSLESQLKDMRSQLESSNSHRDDAIAAATQAQMQQTPQGPSYTTENGHEEGQIDESRQVNLSESERMVLEDRISAAESKAKEAEDRAARVEEQINETVKIRSEKMKAALNKKLTESKEAQKVALEAEYKLKFEQDKQIMLAELKTQPSLTVDTTPSGASTNAPAPPPSTPGHKPASSSDANYTPTAPAQTPFRAELDFANISDSDARNFVSNNLTVKSIITSNVRTKLQAETQKLKEEQEKIMSDKLAEAHLKAEISQEQAVMLADKKWALKVNMGENRLKSAVAKWTVVENAAKETPQKPVVEVYEVAKIAKPVPAAPSATPTSAPSAVSTSAGMLIFSMLYYLLC
jgi:nucleoprotein TPR